MTLNPRKYAVMPVDAEEIDDEALRASFLAGRIVVLPDTDPPYGEVREATEAEQWMWRTNQLQKLRAPIPEDQIEKLPKPKWRGAWDDGKGAKCDECHGYHVLANTIHLDYFGHAQVTERLLEVDPYWDWEPLQWNDQGLPLFDKHGGLWIKLTVCGVTRLGYGDAVGKSASSTAVKEIIGDAIRNAAMRFGVALELWSKIDRQEGKNPGDGESSQRQQLGGRGSGRREGAQQSNNGGASGQAGRGGANAVSGAADRAPNQDALDDLMAVCNDEGIPTNEVRGLWAGWLATDASLQQVDLTRAHADQINAFARFLIEQAVAAEPCGSGAAEPERDASGVSGDAGEGGDPAPEPAAEVAGPDGPGDDGVAAGDLASADGDGVPGPWDSGYTAPDDSEPREPLF